jgi:hypothetical protein
MNILNNNIKINKTDIDYFISFGVNCCNGIAINETKLRKESLPFDSIVSSPKIIYHCLINNFKDFTIFDEKKDFLDVDLNISNLFEIMKDDLTKHTNKYGIFFNHYLDKDIEVVIETFTRRINRFFSILQNSKNVIFIYSTELSIYNLKFRDSQNEYYEYLIKIEEFLLEKFKNITFKIICFNCNVDHVNTDNILNIKVSIDESKLSDNMETHDSTFNEYRLLIKNEINKIFV